MFRMRKKKRYIGRMNLARDVIDWLLFGIKWISNTKKKPRGAFNSHGFINKQKHVDDNATPISLSSHLSSCFSLLLSHPNIKKKKALIVLPLTIIVFISLYSSIQCPKCHIIVCVCLIYLTTSREFKEKQINTCWLCKYNLHLWTLRTLFI